MAISPPNRMVRCSTLTILSSPVMAGEGSTSAMSLARHIRRDVFLPAQEDCRFPGADEATGPPQHDPDHGQPEEQHPILGGFEVWTEDRLQEGQLAQDLDAADHHSSSDGDADHGAH